VRTENGRTSCRATSSTLRVGDDLVPADVRPLELAAAARLLFHATAPFAAVGLGLLLVAMFPAKVRAARGGLTLGGRAVSRLQPRTAIQAGFLLAAVAAI